MVKHQIMKLISNWLKRNFLPNFYGGKYIMETRDLHLSVEDCHAWNPAPKKSQSISDKQSEVNWIRCVGSDMYNHCFNHFISRSPTGLINYFSHVFQLQQTTADHKGAANNQLNIHASDILIGLFQKPVAFIRERVPYSAFKALSIDCILNFAYNE